MPHRFVCSNRTRFRSTQVVAKCLPFYVSPDLASTVLFVGRAVRVLRRPAGGAGGGGRELLPLHDMMQFAQVGPKLSRAGQGQVTIGIPRAPHVRASRRGAPLEAPAYFHVCPGCPSRAFPHTLCQACAQLLSV